MLSSVSEQLRKETKFDSGALSSGNMAAKALRQRSRRGSKQNDANNVNVSTDARTQKDEKGGEDSKTTEIRQE